MDTFSALINVPWLLFSILWILGFSVIFAALSMRHYEAGVEGIPFRQALQAPSFQLPLWIGLTMVTIGFAGNSNGFWEQIIWIGLTVLNVVQAFFAFRERQADRTEN